MVVQGGGWRGGAYRNNEPQPGAARAGSRGWPPYRDPKSHMHTLALSTAADHFADQVGCLAS